MTAPAILARLREAGAAVSLNHGGGVRLASAAPLPAALLAEARTHRATIMAALAAKPGPARAAPPAGDRLSGSAHPPSWTNCSLMPVGCRRCCGGWRWWYEVIDPAGWRCMTCHPPPALPGYYAQVVTMKG